MGRIVVYEDNNYCVFQSETLGIPGCFCVTSKNKNWFVNRRAISELSKIQKAVRDSLMLLGIEVMGIYMEEDSSNNLKSLCIPFHKKTLDYLHIPIDNYQPNIQNYINYYACHDCSDEIFNVANHVRRYLKNLGGLF